MDAGGGGSEKCSKIRHIVRLRQTLRQWRRRAAAPSDVPAGHVAVCVGSSSRRFVVRASHLNHPAFRDLLRQAEEEYGFASRPGPLSLPCDESLFEDLLHLISSSSSSSSSSRFPDYYLDDSEKLSRASSCCCAVGQWLHAADSLPLLHRHRLS
ncbi:hypothetical protein C4D60_Mb07t22170 [Musa balbisiana]|uniref:Uncharacterized protein n=1 Tax=Musa balbisiana TaxID=52838 RepID=A0A4S8JJM5_MUSBA|nr:hypothetical protein C4D60_Mb07t22170 [Musa balbisiana]